MNSILLKENSGNPDYPPGVFGEILPGIADGIGLHPADAGLLISAVLGNVCGRVAGLHGIQGSSVAPNINTSPGMNLLFAGDSVYRFKRVVQRAIGPAIARQEWLREEALIQHRSALNLFKFGPEHSLLPDGPRDVFYDHTLVMKQVIENEVGNAETLPRDWALEFNGLSEPHGFHQPSVHPIKGRLPGVKHRPSFIFVGNDASRLDKALGETFDHRAFLVDLSGEFFKGSFTKGTPAGNRAIAHLVSLLGGTDFEPPLLHPSQGYGSLQFSRATIVASVNLGEIGVIMEGGDVVSSQMLSQAILWNPQWSPVNYDNSMAWAHYEKSLHQVLRERIARQGPTIVLSRENQTVLAALENELDEAMPQQFQRELAAYGTLVQKVLWAFLVLQGSAVRDWAFSATRATVRHALRNHVRILEQAADHAEIRRTKEICRKIVAALARKGSLTARSIQRSINECKQADLAVALDILVQDSRVRFTESSREYELLSSQN